MKFEEAFARLEEILKKMNSGTVPLDEALKLYEEADALITRSSKKLKEAETRIETLMKERDGTLSVDENGEPQTEMHGLQPS